MLKSTLISTPSLNRPFPKLMITSRGKIVLFTRKGTGIVVHSVCTGHLLGYYGKAWTMDDFSDYNGTVELTNE